MKRNSFLTFWCRTSSILKLWKNEIRWSAMTDFKRNCGFFSVNRFNKSFDELSKLSKWRVGVVCSSSIWSNASKFWDCSRFAWKGKFWRIIWNFNTKILTVKIVKWGQNLSKFLGLVKIKHFYMRIWNISIKRNKFYVKDCFSFASSLIICLSL